MNPDTAARLHIDRNATVQSRVDSSGRGAAAFVRTAAAVAFAGLTVAAVNMAHGQNYPNRPVRIVTTEPGSGLDLTARVIAQGISGPLGQQVIVENRRVNSIEIVAAAAPDGYTLLAYGGGLWVIPMLRKVDYDAVRDFAPLTSAVATTNVLVVHPSVAANSVKELIALAKAKPGVLNYASSVTGGTPHLAAELFKSLAGVNIVRVAYKGVAIAVTDLIAGQVQMMFPVVSSAMPHVKAGKLRALAITSSQPSALVPGLPTMAAAGVPGYEMSVIFGMYAPAKTPAPILKRLSDEMLKLLADPGVKEQFFKAGNEVVASTPQQFAAYIKADIARMSKVIKEAGIRDE